MVANDLSSAPRWVRYSSRVSTLKIRPLLSRAYFPSTIPATPEPSCAVAHRKWAAATSINARVPVTTQGVSDRGDSLQGNVFNERYARAGVRRRSTTHPIIISRKYQGKIESTSVPAKLPMYASTLPAKPHAAKTAGNLEVPNLMVTVSASQKWLGAGICKHCAFLMNFCKTVCWNHRPHGFRRRSSGDTAFGDWIVSTVKA
jgi:hypothetical protein